jgi:hypothetical protein
LTKGDLGGFLRAFSGEEIGVGHHLWVSAQAGSLRHQAFYVFQESPKLINGCAQDKARRSQIPQITLKLQAILL